MIRPYDWRQGRRSPNSEDMPDPCMREAFEAWILSILCGRHVPSQIPFYCPKPATAIVTTDCWDMIGPC